MITGKAILITGGCGFVGGRLAQYFAGNNNVTIVDNMRYWKDIPNVVPAGCHLWKSSVGDLFPVEHYDLVIHAATVNIIHGMEDMRACMDTNFSQTLEFFDRIPSDTRILYLSTASVYGNGTTYPTPEECRVAPSNVYAMSKLLAEQYLLSKHENAVVARLSNVYGPRQRPENAYSGVMVKMLMSAMNGKKFTIYGGGGDTRDYTYVDDVVRACELLLMNGKANHVYNVGTGIETSLVDLLRFMPEGVDIEHAPVREIDNIKRRCLDIRKITMDTGWVPQVSLEHGVPETMNWLMSFR